MELCWKEFREKKGKWVLSKITKLSKEESQELIEEAKEKARRDRVAEIAWGFLQGFVEGYRQSLTNCGMKNWLTIREKIARKKLSTDYYSKNLVQKITGLPKEYISYLREKCCIHRSEGEIKDWLDVRILIAKKMISIFNCSTNLVQKITKLPEEYISYLREKR